MPEQFTPEQTATLARLAPHLHAMHTHDGLRAQLRKIEDQEAIVYAMRDRATGAGIDSAEHPSDFDKFAHALTVAREESAATIELETMRVSYITAALDLTKKARINASPVPA